jgi:hypothetical protein
MRGRLVLAFVALTLVRPITSDAQAQAAAGSPGAPVPTFTITGLIDQLMTYSNNTSNFDLDLHRKDYLFYGRTRGRFDIVGAYGRAKAVLGLELDLVYGQTGTSESNVGLTTQSGQLAPGGPGGSAVAAFPATDGSLGLNTDVRGIPEIKWLYTEFPLPYIPYPTIARLGAQPFAAAATLKFGTYATGDFAGVNLQTVITPDVKIVGTYVAVEESLVGRQQTTGTQAPTNSFLGVNPFQERGDDWALIIAPEFTPFRGLTVKPMYSYFTAAGTTSISARQGRGGISATQWFTNNFGGTDNEANGTWRKGINESRHTLGLDARYRRGPFSFEPSVLYQFGNRSLIAPCSSVVVTPPNDGGPIPPCPAGTTPMPSQFVSAGVIPNRKYTANETAWLMDVRGGYQLGPVLLEGLFMFTTGNKARETTLRTVKYFQPLDTDTGYLADWGGQLTAAGVDYLNGLLEVAGQTAYPGTAIGWDKYGRYQIGARATYEWTPEFSLYGGVNGHWTAQDVQKNAILGAGLGIIPLFTGQDANNKSQYIGTEIFTGLTWRFAPGLSFDAAGGYMWTGHALDAVTNPAQGARDARNVYILSSRVRFAF